MKVFSLICLFIGLAQCQRPNEECWRECDWTNYVALVTCPYEITDNTPCTCERQLGDTPEERDCISTIQNDVLLTEEGLKKWENCHDLADNYQTNIVNTYFRWENKAVSEEFYCYLLPDCEKEVPSGCVPFVGSSCTAGPSTTPCEPEPNLSCDPAVWNPTAIHWTCVSSDKTESISPYNEEQIAEGTTCQTVQECSTWVWGTDPEGPEVSKPKRKANAKCGAGGWESADPALQLFYPDDTDKANEILPSLASPKNDGLCDCETLIINEDAIDNQALSLVCEHVFNPADNGIMPGNACALLCDGHFMKYIECFKGVWMNTAEYPFMEVTTVDIKC